MNDQSMTMRHALSRPCDGEAQSLVQVCLLGSFLLLKAGQPVVLRNGGKTKALLTQLGLQPSHRIPRETLLQMLWPDNDPALASQSLHSLVYGFHKLVGDSLRGAAPVYHDEGCYRLNIEAGIRVDVACFDTLVKTGDQGARSGDLATAERRAHSTKGLAGTIGAPALQQAAKALETALRERDAALETLFTGFADELRQVTDGIARGFDIERSRPG